MYRVIPPGRPFERALIGVGSLLAAGALAVAMGHDANWDLRNYHLYNAFAFFGWRYGEDLVPAEMQSLFNPLIELPYYAIARSLGLQAATLFQSVYYAVLICIAYACGVLVYASAQRDGGRLPVRPLAVVAAILGVTGAGSLPQVATVFNEIQLAILIVGGMACLLSALDTPALRLQRVFWSGTLLGAAAGLKLTAAMYAPAFVVALIAALGLRNTRSLIAAVWFCVGWVVAALTVFGWWGIVVFQRFGSPVFPLYNAVFRSRWYPPIDEVDERFFPKSPAEWIAYPFNWAWRTSGEISEPAMRDPRLALFLLALIGLAFVNRRRVIASERLRFLLVLGPIAYAIWLVLFSTLRYAVPIEIIAGLTIVLFVATTFTKRSFVCVLAGYAVVQYATVYPVWGRIPFSETRYEFALPALPDGSLVLTSTAPVGYVLPFLATNGTSFVNAGSMAADSQGYALFDQIREKISQHPGPIFVLGRGSPNTALLGALGVVVQAETCRTITSNLEPEAREISICGATKT